MTGETLRGTGANRAPVKADTKNSLPNLEWLGLDATADHKITTH